MKKEIGLGLGVLLVARIQLAEMLKDSRAKIFFACLFVLALLCISTASALTVTVHTPENITYNINFIYHNVSADEAVDYCNLSVDSSGFYGMMSMANASNFYHITMGHTEGQHHTQYACANGSTIAYSPEIYWTLNTSVITTTTNTTTTTDDEDVDLFFILFWCAFIAVMFILIARSGG